MLLTQVNRPSWHRQQPDLFHIHAASASDERSSGARIRKRSSHANPQTKNRYQMRYEKPAFGRQIRPPRNLTFTKSSTSPTTPHCRVAGNACLRLAEPMDYVNASRCLKKHRRVHQNAREVSTSSGTFRAASLNDSWHGREILRASRQRRRPRELLNPLACQASYAPSGDSSDQNCAASPAGGTRVDSGVF